MLDKIRNNEELKKYLVENCCDEGICLEIEDTVTKEDIVIIKVDNYYNDQKLGKSTPPSPDCLIIIKCKEGGYSLHIAELKNITSSKGYNINNMLNKFDTCFEDFIFKRFRDLLFIDYKRIKLYFISKIDIHSKDMGLKYELLTSHRIKYNNKSLMIRAFIPIASIKGCY